MYIDFQKFFAFHTGKCTDFSLPTQKQTKKGTKVQPCSCRTLVSQTFLTGFPQIYMYIDLEIIHMYKTVL